MDSTLSWGALILCVEEAGLLAQTAEALSTEGRAPGGVRASEVRLATLQAFEACAHGDVPTVLVFAAEERDAALDLLAAHRVSDVVERDALSSQLPLALRRIARGAGGAEPLTSALRLLQDVNEIEQTKVGVDYLNVMVERLARALGFDYVFVGEIDDSDTSIHTCALWTPSGKGENFAYDLVGTPCLEVFTGRRVCTHPAGVADEFPDDLLLRQMGIEAYVGAPLVRPDGKGLGLFVALDSKPRHDTARFEPVLEFFASRASAELDRVRVERRLRAANEELERRVSERTEELEVTQLRVIELAHRAGMADAAAVVLHNVGNLLNSVTVGAARMTETASALPVQALGQAAALIDEHRHDLADFLANDAKGKRLPSLLSEIEAVLRADVADLVEDAQTVQLQARQIADVVRAQKEHVDHDRLSENADPVQLVRTCARLYAEDMRSEGVDLEVRTTTLPQVRVQRNKLFQVLGNLLRNAADALSDADGAARRILVSFREEPKHVAVVVTDSGPGVPETLRDRLFEFGFSTKASGAGVGLHSSANFMTEMGGSLSLSPQVPGEGATFVVRLPRADASTQAAG